MQGEESGEQVSAGAAAQFAAGASAFGWAGYARAWVDVKQTAHEDAVAATVNVELAANQAAYQAYVLALSSPPETGSAEKAAEEAAAQAFAQYVRDAANAMPEVQSLPEVIEEAMLAELIWGAVTATRTEDAAGLLSRAGAFAATTETADTPETRSTAPETGSEGSDAWENVSATSETWENMSDPSGEHLSDASWENLSDTSGGERAGTGGERGHDRGLDRQRSDVAAGTGRQDPALAGQEGCPAGEGRQDAGGAQRRRRPGRR